MNAAIFFAILKSWLNWPKVRKVFFQFGIRANLIRIPFQTKKTRRSLFNKKMKLKWLFREKDILKVFCA